ncbi:AGE family epimerase/isomerase [uncultured Gilvimarinus sp.]|uniref:AGE family epimerase/isomerase n=1 Tax=uncultured Gilvimarinus sp. TaxID=1689143 RepID=UPI0030ECC4E8|tara:strand:+ start:1877 stop:3049 length:1173 start_codon:yes stop_codon:yes gene_type:complete
MSNDIQGQTRRLTQWFARDALPLWSERSIHPDLGASFERLRPDGEVDVKANVRVRVQARQAFFFAAAHSLGWCDRGADIAHGLLAFVESNAAHPTAGGGFTHLLNPEFEVIDTKQDLYDHAFFLLAYAWLYRVSGERTALDKAEALVRHLDKRFAADYGGWAEGDYAYSVRRQNPHMHLFEACMALYEASGEAHWLARAGELFSLFESRFFCPEQGVLFEFFNADWTLAEGATGQVIEPGHMMEWVWLLDWYARLSGQSVSRYTGVLYRRALELGLKADSGLLFDSVTPQGEVLQHTKRCWGLTELIKASLVMAREGEPGAEARAAEAVNTLFSYYLCGTTPGSYVDQRGQDDEIVAAEAPASTLYHLIVLAQELMRYCDELPGQPAVAR